MQENVEKNLSENNQTENETKVVVKYPMWLILISAILLFSTVYLGSELILQKNASLDVNKKVEVAPDTSELEHYESRYSKIENIRNFIESNFYQEVSDEQLQDGMIRGMFLSLEDPYSVYYTEEEYNSFMELNEGSYGGLGITITPSKDGFITVVGTFEDTPASRAGIKMDDKIIKVNGEPYPADKMDIAISKMKGEPGTSVNITILRGEEEIEMNLERAQIVIKSVKSEVLKDNPKIGYIRISSFDQKVYDEFKKHYEKLLDEGIEGFVLDLRGNPGGSLMECVEVSDYILGKQRIVSTKGRSGGENVFDSDSSKVELPFVVLIDGGSASASEILSAAIKDGKAAKLVGTKTFGKGVVQTVIPLSDGSGFKFTTSEYFTPSGKNIHEKGIEPDVEVELSEDFKIEDRSTDNQLNKALEILESDLK